MDYGGAYAVVKVTGSPYTDVIPPDGALSTADLNELRARCEMVLVREYDDWYVGKPDLNISRAIHRRGEVSPFGV